MTKRWLICFLTILAGWSQRALVTVLAETTPVSFRREVLPLLSDRCFQCHGPDGEAREADLRLDRRESALELGALVPHDPDASELVRRIFSDDEEEVMPPPTSQRKQLTESERELLVQWIRDGAEYESHWSFLPPQRAAPPEVADDSRVRHAIDRFVLARLEQESLTPSPEADRRTLIRRVSLDLTGLPPTSEEVRQFIRDPRDDAYERLVDRLLARRQFGERLALDWLDAARYADTNGYSIDGGRHIWLWRDWVINAFNRNLPFDRFLVEQLAGDLLASPTSAQLIATGFQRNNMVTHEGGTIPEENLTNYNADRVKTLGEAVLGLTLGCAQCHDHKFDPITQEDYYRLFAYFNTVSDQGLDGNRGKNPRPFFQTKTVLPDDELPSLEQRIYELKNLLARVDAGQFADWVQRQQAELSQRGADLKLHRVELIKVSTPNRGSGFGIENSRYVRISEKQELAAYDVSLGLPRLDRPVSGLRIVFSPDDATPGQGRGFGSLSNSTISQHEGSDAAEEELPGTFVLTTLSVSADDVPSDQVDLHGLLLFSQVTADSWIPRFPPEGIQDTRGVNGWSPDASLGAPTDLTVSFDTPIDSAETPFVSLQLNFGFGNDLLAARFEILAMTGRDDGSPLPRDVIKIVETNSGQRSPVEEARLREYFADHAPATQAWRTELSNLEERISVLTSEFPTMVMDQAEKPRDTFILNRGDYAQPTTKVEPGTPAALPSLGDDARNDRLGLAQWITMPDHPLTARVAVNRFWQMLFGRGIVASSADFGLQGDLPSHPALLDWLAVEFVEGGWDVKQLIRGIVTSATYRQTSTADPQRLERDRANRLLSRGPRFRLPAEFIRDGALKVSGLLVDRVGGPSVNPYTPGDLWREVSHYGSSPATSQSFVQDHGEKLYRRSLYTYWKRAVPPPNMSTFDAPSRETCVVSRPTTITPLQALVLLNDVQFVEATRALAERIMKQSADNEERIRWAFEEVLSRPPSDAERAILRRALERELDRYTSDQEAARSYLSNGESPRDTSLPVVEHAAWSQVAAVLLNLSETVTRY